MIVGVDGDLKGTLTFITHFMRARARAREPCVESIRLSNHFHGNKKDILVRFHPSIPHPTRSCVSCKEGMY